MLIPSCPDFEASPGSRRCRHYHDGGGCELAQHDECIEWRRVNPSARARTPSLRAGDDAPRSVPLRANDVESFKALGVEVCVDSPVIGQLWLVPKHTEQPRCEMTPEDVEKVAHILRTFPGATVIDMRLLPSG